MNQIKLTDDERKFLYFFPPAVGGVQPPDSVRDTLVAKGLVALNPSDGRYWATEKGDAARRGEPVR